MTQGNEPDLTPRRRNSAKVAIGAVLAVVVLALGGTWLYINVIKEDAPERLSLDDDRSTESSATTATTAAPTDSTTETTAAGTTTTDGVDGEWTVTEDSIVGYRAKEVLFGQDTEGVGRTNSVTGSMTIAGTSVDDASFEVDMTSLRSDSSQRDGQFNGRIMQTDEFPTATFELTSPIDLGDIPADGTEVTATATGDLTIKGETKSVELNITAKHEGATVSVLTEYDVVFADWNIDDPSFGPAQVEPNALLEIKLVFAKA